jgi:hypothetical protein
MVGGAVLLSGLPIKIVEVPWQKMKFQWDIWEFGGRFMDLVMDLLNLFINGGAMGNFRMRDFFGLEVVGSR